MVWQRDDDDLVAPIDRNRRKTEHLSQADKRQQPVAERHDAQHMSIGLRHPVDTVGDLNDLLHMLDRERVFLPGDLETDELQLVDRCRICRDGSVGPASLGLSDPPRRRAELAFYQPQRIEDHDHAAPIRGLDHSPEQVGIHRRLNRTRTFDLSRLRGENRRHSVDDQSDRNALVDHDHTGRVIVGNIGIPKDPSQAGDRHHGSPEVGQTFQTAVAERHLDHLGHADDLLHLGERHREDAVVDVEGHVL